MTAFAILFSACIIRILAEQPNNVITGCMILFGAINIVAFAPLESPEKPLDSDQKKQYSCIPIVILVGLVAAAVLANLLNLHGLESVAAVSLVPEGILLASGRMQARQAKR